MLPGVTAPAGGGSGSLVEAAAWASADMNGRRTLEGPGCQGKCSQDRSGHGPRVPPRGWCGALCLVSNTEDHEVARRRQACRASTARSAISSFSVHLRVLRGLREKQSAGPHGPSQSIADQNPVVRSKIAANRATGDGSARGKPARGCRGTHISCDPRRGIPLVSRGKPYYN